MVLPVWILFAVFYFFFSIPTAEACFDKWSCLGGQASTCTLFDLCIQTSHSAHCTAINQIFVICKMFTIYAQCSPNMQNDHNALNLHNLNYVQTIPMLTICKIWTCSMNWFDDISLWTLSNLQCSSQNSISSYSNVEQKLTSVFLLCIRTIVKL